MFNSIFNEEFIKVMRQIIKEEMAAQLCATGVINVPQQADNKPYLKGMQELADFLGVSKSTAQKLKNNGVIPYSQQPWSKIVLFDKEKVKLALQENQLLKKISKRSRKG